MRQDDCCNLTSLCPHPTSSRRQQGMYRGHLKITFSGGESEDFPQGRSKPDWGRHWVLAGNRFTGGGVNLCTLVLVEIQPATQ